MFTGLIKEIGTIRKISPTTEGIRICVESVNLIKDIKIDDSVAINGVCQTAVKVSENSFEVEAVKVTLEKTSLGQLRQGDPVNLELALRPIDRMGGHFVQGHVNGVGEIGAIAKNGKNYVLRVKFKEELNKYIVKEGSIAIEGISLTVSDKTDQYFEVSIIPHTFENTILKHKKVGSIVNIEVDILAKYIENLLFNAKKEKTMTLDWLGQKGF